MIPGAKGLGRQTFNGGGHCTVLDPSCQAAGRSIASFCSASTRYTVARLTPSVAAIVLADSPLALHPLRQGSFRFIQTICRWSPC